MISKREVKILLSGCSLPFATISSKGWKHILDEDHQERLNKIVSKNPGIITFLEKSRISSSLKHSPLEDGEMQEWNEVIPRRWAGATALGPLCPTLDP